MKRAEEGRCRERIDGGRTVGGSSVASEKRDGVL